MASPETLARKVAHKVAGDS